MNQRCFVANTRVSDQSPDIGPNIGTDLMMFAIVLQTTPGLHQGPADLQSAARTTELCTHLHVTSNAAVLERICGYLNALLGRCRDLLRPWQVAPLAQWLERWSYEP